MFQQRFPQAVSGALNGAPRKHTLTESQIVSMPERDYMGDEQRNFFRARLMDIEDMLKSRALIAAGEIASSSDVSDPIDRASAEEEHQMALSAKTRDVQHLTAVGAALHRIKTEEFGWCVETGEMIGIDRLLICPTATLCVEAQQRLENKTKRYRV